MTITTRTQTRPNLIAAISPIAAALIAIGLQRLHPLLSPLLVTMVLGAIIVNSPLRHIGWLRSTPAMTKFLLRLGVVMIGIKLPLGDIVAVGLPGLVIIVVTVALTYWLTQLIGARLGLDRGLVSLLAAGFSICGASAIAAVSDAVKARERDVAIAVALVTIFGTAMILTVPIASGVLGLSDEQAGAWAGASIHEVAQVAVAASLVGTGALAIAMTIKLGRVALLAPVYVLAARLNGTDGKDTSGTERKVPQVPWFIYGFIAAVAIRTFVPLSDPVLGAADLATTLFLGAGMFGLGLGLHFAELRPIAWRAVWLAFLSTFIAAVSSLALVVVLL